MRHVFTWYPVMFCLSHTSQADRARVATVSQTAKPTGYNTNTGKFASGSCTFRGMNHHLQWEHQRGDLSMTRPRPFRFGVSVSQARSKAEWVATAREIESRGYSTLLMPDHLGHQLAPIAALQAAAEATPTLRIGGLVFANDFRHPVLMARKARTV